MHPRQVPPISPTWSASLFAPPKAPAPVTICNITALPPQTRQLIAQSLRGQSFVAPEALALTDAWSYGGLAVLHQAWEDLELDAAL